MKVRHGALLAAGMTLALVACGSSGSKDGTVSSVTTTSTTTVSPTTTTVATKAFPDPCQLVTKADAVALAGTALEDGVKSGADDDLSCTYAGLPTGPTAQVELFVGPGAKKFYDVDTSLDHAFVDVPGLGDEAHLEDFTLFFRTGDRWNALRLTTLNDFEPYRQPMIDLATKVAKAS